MRTTSLLALLVCRAMGDGMIVIPDHPATLPPPRVQNQMLTGFPLEVNYHHVDVRVDQMAAYTSIDQEFVNPTGNRLEGVYIFPIPDGAVIDKFSMFIDGKETPAEMLDAQKARAIYEDLLRKMIDPALLEYYGRGVFKARIFPIEPHGVKRVKISYREVLTREAGTIAYSYPLNTEKFSSKPLRELSIRVKITSADPLKNVYCTSHDAEVIRKGPTEATVGLEAKNVKPDRDFDLFYSTDKSKFGLSMLTFREAGEDGFFFVNLSPSYDPGADDTEEKDITFVLDVSGSMAGKKLDQAKRALNFCIANLNKGDRFEIVRFSTEAEALFGKLTPADDAGRAKAVAFVGNLQAIGGTNIEEALKLALKTKSADARPYMVLFITDGKPTIGETSENALVQQVQSANTGHTRIFTFGIGDEINTHLLDKLVAQTQAWRTYVTADEDIEIKISDLYTKLQSPVLTGLSLDFGGGVEVRQMYPKPLPDLFRGSSITILGRYSGNGAVSATLKGTLKGKEYRSTYQAEFASKGEAHSFIPSLWAARRVGYLLDQIRLNGEDKELVDEVTLLARKHGIITPYTSYLILEDETDKVATRRIPQDQTTLSAVMAPRKAELTERTRAEYKKFASEKSGAAAGISTEVQSLQMSKNADQIQQGQSRLSYKDDAGAERNVTQQVRTVQGRAFYDTGRRWVDAMAQAQKNARIAKIKYASPEYFTLIRGNAAAAQYAALGRNVTFVMNGAVYEVSE